MKDALLATAFFSLILCPFVINRLASATHAPRRDGIEAKRA